MTTQLKFTNPPGLYDPRPNGYSHIAVVAPDSKLVFLAGQGGESEDGTRPAEFQPQVRQALSNLQTALRAVGSDLTCVARLTVLVVDHTEERLHVFGAELDRVLAGTTKPACTLIPVPRLALDGMLFEIEATAIVPGMAGMQPA